MRKINLIYLTWLLALLHCVCARFALMPKFYGQDSAVIVDTDKQMPPQLHPKLRNNALYYNVPMYKLIKPELLRTTTTPAPTLVDNEQYPSDLLYIARNKLGLKRLDELPSLSELSELLGTGSASETIKYIRTLTSNDQGIALMKAYLESLDYAQADSDDEVSAEDQVEDEEDKQDDANALNNADIDGDDYEVQPTRSTTSTTPKAPAAQLGDSFMQRVGDFMNKYNLWSVSSSTTVAPTTRSTQPVLSFQPVFVAPAAKQQPQALMHMRPMLVRQPLPYHYPIPLRPAMLPAKPTNLPSTTTAAPKTATPTSAHTATHLNSPKISEVTLEAKGSAAVAPHVQHLAQMANISPQVLDQFLQQQPKLAELAKRVSRLPLAQQNSHAIDSQLFVAVQRALSKDEELKRLLSAAQTLK